VNEQVERVLVEVLQVAPSIITDELTMKDLEVWDSLKHMELVVSLEQSFNVQFTFDEIVTMQSVGAIKRILNEKV
jgi:acyl carrier protein